METLNAIAALTALGHATRLAAFRLLVQAGLVESESQGRHVCYRANFDAMNGLIEYLTHNCCAGSPDAECAPAAPACKC
jgi:ArsR family transcriptional regulator, arsenate/arsenite/antimonite-responsive transcriptional repressor